MGESAVEVPYKTCKEKRLRSHQVFFRTGYPGRETSDNLQRGSSSELPGEAREVHQIRIPADIRAAIVGESTVSVHQR